MTATGPDHAALLRGDVSPVLTPRTSQALYHAFGVLADNAYDDVEQYGNGPLDEDSQILRQYPRFTWGCDAAWRRQAARAYDDLAEDMAAGDWPQPRCPAEEIAVILAVAWAENMTRDLPEAFEFDDLPVMDEDFDWQMVLDLLMQDMDMELLLDPAWDGGRKTPTAT